MTPASPPQYPPAPQFGDGIGGGEHCNANSLLGPATLRVPSGRGNVLFSFSSRTVCPGCFPEILHGAGAGQAVLGAEKVLHPVSDTRHEAFNSLGAVSSTSCSMHSAGAAEGRMLPRKQENRPKTQHREAFLYLQHPISCWDGQHAFARTCIGAQH